MKTRIIYENEVSFNAFRMMDKDFLTSNIQSELHYRCLERATQEQIKSDLVAKGLLRRPNVDLETGSLWVTLEHL